MLGGGAAQAAGPAPAAPGAPAAQICADLAATPWPARVDERAALLLRMERSREACLNDAPFLALLGALWLESGEPAQALLWLERSLLLAPDTPGAVADHALALAALGERTALAELLLRWRDRQDIPPALRNRLDRAWASSTRQVPASAGNTPRRGLREWTWRRTVSALYGNESNLDRSPRLTEITLSSPDGPIDLPLAVPFVPRAGRAWVGEGSLQGQYATAPDTLWQLGVQLGARHSREQPDTDHDQAQVALARWQQHDGWRSQLQATALRVGGPLSDPYRALTLGAAVEREWNGCFGRAGLDAEWRQQEVNTIADSRTFSVQSGLQCRLQRWPGWGAGLALRASLDMPLDPARPGGRQSQYTLGLRASGPVAAGFRLELGWRQAWLTDATGYSPLLEADARRRQRQQQFSLELSRPLPQTWAGTPEWVLQVQGLRQASNIKLFQHRGASSFTGLRWDW